MNNKYLVIMAGGIGSRFWPYSRNSRPKQFLDILNTGRTLIQMTYDRFTSFIPKENIFVVTLKDYEHLVEEQLPELSENQILLEPQRRNTAPCIAYASYKISKINPEAIITVAPSDHLILNQESFLNSWNLAVDTAQSPDQLVTIGIKPHKPETGFGYIQFLENNSDVKKVKTFTEKPEIELAKTFLESGDFVWNSGIFIWHVRSILSEIKKSLPELDELFNEALPMLGTDEEYKAVALVYSQCKNISIDYGVMEHSENVSVVLGDFSWSDLGSWNALYDHSEKDENNNAIQGNALIYETKNTLIKASNDKLILVQGLDNYMITECDNVMIICSRENEERFREFVADVKDKKGKEFL